MARKFAFDASIAADIKAAAGDSFADNIRMISIDDIITNNENFYSTDDVELLADDIERQGLKHNLVVIDNADGRYRLISGHRRLKAIKQLAEEKRITAKNVPCYVLSSGRSDEEAQLDLIMLNATSREYTDADRMEQARQLEKVFRSLDEKGILSGGRIREKIAAAMKVSPAQVGKIENIRNNAIDEIQSAIQKGDMSISTANEVAKLPEEKQHQLIESVPTFEIRNKDVTQILRTETEPETQVGEETSLEDFSFSDSKFSENISPCDESDYESCDDILPGQMKISEIHFIKSEPKSEPQTPTLETSTNVPTEVFLKDCVLKIIECSELLSENATAAQSIEEVENAIRTAQNNLDKILMQAIDAV